MPRRNILVRAVNWVGDAVMSLPALRALRAAEPEAHITLLTRAWAAGLYRRETAIDERLPLPAGRLRAARLIRSRRFDTAILLPNSFDSALGPFLARVPERIGYARDGRSPLLSQPIAPPRPGEIPAQQSFYYLELLRRAGLIPELPPAAPILLDGAEEARRAGRALLDAMGFDGPLVGVSPGAENSRAKQWPPERFAEAAAEVADALGASVVLFGSPKERPLCRGVAEDLRRRGRRVLNLAGETTLSLFIDMAAACRVFLTNDSGAMHAASALGAPTVAVFGPTEWFATGPAGPRAVIVREPVECSPCMLRDCPIDHRCMTAISPSRVAQTALELVK